MPFLWSKDAPDTASAHAGADLGKTTLGHRIFTIQELTQYILGAIPEHSSSEACSVGENKLDTSEACSVQKSQVKVRPAPQAKPLTFSSAEEHSAVPASFGSVLRRCGPPAARLRNGWRLRRRCRRRRGWRTDDRRSCREVLRCCCVVRRVGRCRHAAIYSVGWSSGRSLPEGFLRGVGPALRVRPATAISYNICCTTCMPTL